MIKFNNFDRVYKAHEKEIDQAIKNVLQSSWYVLGTQVDTFEKKLADYVGTKYAVGVASGTDALILSLMCADIGPGDEVITTDLTAYATITAIQAVGAQAVCVDVSPETGLIDPVKIEDAINAQTKAVIPVHLYGQACEMNDILELTKRTNTTVIEDCAQAIGAKDHGKIVGSAGDFGCFSFYPTKNLGAYGDAGAICTNSKKDYEKLKQLRNYGQTERYIHGIKGLNSRLDEIQAAILNVKIDFLGKLTQRRRDIAERYIYELPNELLLQFKTTSVFHLFPIKVENRDSVLKKLNESGIESLIHYPIPVSQQDAFDGVARENTEVRKLCNSLISLPICPYLTDDEIGSVITAVSRSLK
jgi:dTDP-4-amino-4,6-dideoxygalactose transaminase